MNKFIFRKSMVLLLAVVMLASSALVNIPAYALFGSSTIIDLPIYNHTIVEGTDGLEDILLLGTDDEDLEAARVFMRQTVFDINWYKDRIGFREYAREGNMYLDDFYAELLSTEGLKPGGPYELVVTVEDIGGDAGLLELIFGNEADVVYIVNLTVTPFVGAVDDEADTMEAIPVDIDFLGNDMLPEGLFASATISELFGVTEDPLFGEVEFVADGSSTLGYKIVYTPMVGFVGEETFNYKVHAEDDSWNHATVTVDVMVDNETYPWNIVGAQIFTQVGELGSVDLTGLIETGFVQVVSDPSVEFDFGSAAITSLELAPEFGPGDGAPSFDGLVASYLPNQMTQVILKAIVEDQNGRIAMGDIAVTVFEDSSFARVVIDEPEIDRLNQYYAVEPPLIGENPNDVQEASVRAGVSYYPSMDANIMYQFEKVTFQNPINGFYDTSMKDSDLNPISIIYYFGDFSVEYHMEDSEEYKAFAGFRNISVNAKPQISMTDTIDPHKVVLPGGSVDVTPLDRPEYDDKENYKSFDILTMLYGYDFEDYNSAIDNHESMAVNIELYPEIQVKFYLPDGDDGYVAYPIEDFWEIILVMIPGGDVPDGSRESGEWNDVAYTVYDIRFTLTDTEGHESEMTESWGFKVTNTKPELRLEDLLEDQFVVIAEDADFDPMSLLTVVDPEDLNLMSIEEMRAKVVMNVTRNSVPFDPDPIRINDEGIYEVVFDYTDEHGYDADTRTLEVHVIRAPEITVLHDPVIMEVDGWYPVFNGLDIEFYDPEDVDLSCLYEGKISYEFEAYPGVVNPYEDFGDEFIIEPLDDLVQITSEDANPFVITYVATTKVYIGEDEWYPVYGYETRTINVVDPVEGDLIYLIDFWKTNGIVTIEAAPVDLPSVLTDEEITNEERRRRGIKLDVYPILIKFDPDTEEETLVTAMVEDKSDIMRPQSIIRFDDANSFDDIAVLSDGSVYVLDARDDVYKLNTDTMMFDHFFDITREMEDVAGDSIHCLNYQSMTVDDLDRLVIAVGYVDILNSGDDEVTLYDMAMLYFDPAVLPYVSEGNSTSVGTAVEGPDVILDPVPEPEYHYLVGLGLIDLGKVVPTVTLSDEIEIVEFDFVPFDRVTDIAFSDDFTTIYGIGNYYDEPSYEQFENVGSEVGSIYPEYWKSRNHDGDFYHLFKVVEDTEVEDFLGFDVFYKYFELEESIKPAEGYRYKGIAVIDDDIYVTKYVSPRLLDMFEQGTEEYDLMLYKTDLDVYNDIDGLVKQVGTPEVGGLFNGAYGAANKYDRDLSLVASASEIQAGATVNLLLTAKPESIHGDGSWIENGSSDLGAIDRTAYGIETATYTSIAGTPGTSVDVTFTVTTNEGDVSVVVAVVTPPAPPAPPVTPTRTTTPTPTIRVTLDTDAVTLDYGETADPEFTSYDFTETVTGTTNRNVTWELSDDEFVTVDENGVVTAKGDVPTDTGDFTVTLTVRTVVGNATDTATILFEEQTPLGAIEFFDPYIAGYPDNSFRPTNYVTRAEVASMFAKILKLNITTSGSQKFMDVQETHWAYGQVQAMYRSGVFAGYMDVDGSRYFDPEAPISRAEIAQVFTNYWKFLDISVNGGTVTSVPDVEANFWAAPAINRIFNTGIVTGFDDGTYRPHEATLREQIVSMINRLIDRPANKADASKFTDILPTHNHFGDIEAASQTFLKPQPE